MFISLISIVITAIPAVAQNNNEIHQTISLTDRHPQYDMSNPQFLPEPGTFFPMVSKDLLNPNLLLPLNTSISRFNSEIWNYNLSDTTKWSNHFSLVSFNQLATHTGLGKYNNIGMSFLWSPIHNLYIETSAFVSKQFGYVFTSRHILYGTGMTLNYVITDKLLFRTWGQYVAPGNDDPFLNLNHFFPKTCAGADLEYKLNQKIGIGVGIEYQYDKKESTWKSESGGKVKIGF